MAGKTPMVETVMRLGLQPKPSVEVNRSNAGSTLSRLSMGSPIPMKTTLVKVSTAGMDRIWLRISAVLRLALKPIRPVMQKAQPILQPTWDDTQSVALSASGIYTASIKPPFKAGNRYLMVPSVERAALTGG